MFKSEILEDLQKAYGGSRMYTNQLTSTLDERNSGLVSLTVTKRQRYWIPPFFEKRKKQTELILAFQVHISVNITA